MVVTILRSWVKMVGMDRLYDKTVSEHCRRERQMLFLMGPRQVGKTTTGRRAGADRERSLYLNWDNVDHQREIVAGPSRLAQLAGTDLLAESKPLLILDEIHKYENWRALLKGFFDTHGADCDLLVTGSARLNVFNSSGESLMGRYFSYRMHPLSVTEMVAPHQQGEPGEVLPRLLDDGSWQALLRFGGFPEPLVRQEERFANRWQRLRHQQLFREELRDLTRIQELSKVQVLSQLLVRRVGQLVSYSSLAGEVGATLDSIKRWLATLENLYFSFSIRPWFRNVARSLRKEPKVYLWDWSLLTDPGARFENMVASALLKACHFWTDDGYGDFGLYFVRDKERREVDFLVSRDGVPWLLVETKVGDSSRVAPGLTHHWKQLTPPHAVQVSRDLAFVERDCFALDRPMVVPARTFLSQLV